MRRDSTSVDVVEVDCRRLEQLERSERHALHREFDETEKKLRLMRTRFHLIAVKLFYVLVARVTLSTVSFAVLWILGETVVEEWQEKMAIAFGLLIVVPVVEAWWSMFPVTGSTWSDVCMLVCKFSRQMLRWSLRDFVASLLPLIFIHRLGRLFNELLVAFCLTILVALMSAVQGFLNKKATLNETKQSSGSKVFFVDALRARYIKMPTCFDIAMGYTWNRVANVLLTSLFISDTDPWALCSGYFVFFLITTLSIAYGVANLTCALPGKVLQSSFKRLFAWTLDGLLVSFFFNIICECDLKGKLAVMCTHQSKFVYAMVLTIVFVGMAPLIQDEGPEKPQSCKIANIRPYDTRSIGSVLEWEPKQPYPRLRKLVQAYEGLFFAGAHIILGQAWNKWYSAILSSIVAENGKGMLTYTGTFAYFWIFACITFAAFRHRYREIQRPLIQRLARIMQELPIIERSDGSQSTSNDLKERMMQMTRDKVFMKEFRESVSLLLSKLDDTLPHEHRLPGASI